MQRAPAGLAARSIVADRGEKLLTGFQRQFDRVRTFLPIMTQGCPHCGSGHVRRSRRNELERGLRPLHKAYRCRKCGARFWRIAPLTWGGLAVTVVFAVVAGVLWVQEPEVPDPETLAERLEAARERNGETEYAEAVKYLAGQTTPDDLARGLRLLQGAASYGHSPAQYRLGVMLRDGVGVAVDDERAVTWFRVAGDAGYPAAQLA
ncbi:MAG: tetratricopeptide repeat protein, partial [Casimicrobiaceae bacterium]